MSDTLMDLSYAFESRTEAVRATLQAASRDLAEFGLSTYVVSAIELVVAEALNNVVEHAYRFEDGHPVELFMALKGRTLHCRITDEGHPMPMGAPPEGKRPDVSGPLEDIPEGGYGWFLIRAFCEGLTYRREDDKNHLTFRIALNNDLPV